MAIFPPGSRSRTRTAATNVVPLWHAKCHVDQKGKPIPNLFNATIALAEDPAFAGKFAYDDMLRSPMFEGVPAEDQVLIDLHRMVQDLGLRRIALDTVHEAVRYVCYANTVHPLRDWLHSLQWDGKIRMPDWLHTYLGVKRSRYVKAVGTMFLVAMVKRVFEPGCQSDYMLVLEGPQGILKSQACRILGGAYYSDTLPDLGLDHVRVSMHLRGKWLIEAPELASLMSHRVSAARLKAFLTTQIEQFTPKHARTEAREPRQCVFVGTVNETDWHRDETGGRRFWPVLCGAIDINGLERDRDQLFAEAVLSYQDGVRPYPDRKLEKSAFAPEQEKRLWRDAWEAPVGAFLNGKRSVTIHQVAHDALEFQDSRLSESDQIRLSKVMKGLGWIAKRSAFARWWEPKK